MTYLTIFALMYVIVADKSILSLIILLGVSAANLIQWFVKYLPEIINHG